MFRSGTLRESSQTKLVGAYIRHVISNETSVWLAQREGRAKMEDLTSPALIRMLISNNGRKGWESLNVCPVSISYEWDPCDALKVRELLITNRDGAYKKSPGEDEIVWF